MVRYCSVPFCGHSTRKNKDLSFHQFPSCEAMRDKWLIFLSVTGWKIAPTEKLNEYHVVCSTHFTPDSFGLSTIKRRRLLPNAVPTIFKSYKKWDETFPVKNPNNNTQSDCSEKIVRVLQQPNSSEIVVKIGEENLTNPVENSEENSVETSTKQCPKSVTLAEIVDLLPKSILQKIHININHSMPSNFLQNLDNLPKKSYESVGVQASDFVHMKLKKRSQSLVTAQKKNSKLKKKCEKLEKEMFQIKKLKFENSVLKAKLEQHKKHTKKLHVDQVVLDAGKGEERAKFLLKQLKMYTTKYPDELNGDDD